MPSISPLRKRKRSLSDNMICSTRRLKCACYFNNLSIAVVGTLSPVLFLTFHDLYNISYTKLGFLVLINFSTQLCVDLLMSLISKRIKTGPLIRSMPFFTMAGFALFGFAPFIPFWDVYPWLVCGTVLFSLSAGLNEVFTSPISASIPADNPEKEMRRKTSWFLTYGALWPEIWDSKHQRSVREVS